MVERVLVFVGQSSAKYLGGQRVILPVCDSRRESLVRCLAAVPTVGALCPFVRLWFDSPRWDYRCLCPRAAGPWLRRNMTWCASPSRADPANSGRSGVCGAPLGWVKFFRAPQTSKIDAPEAAVDADASGPNWRWSGMLHVGTFYIGASQFHPKEVLWQGSGAPSERRDPSCRIFACPPRRPRRLSSALSSSAKRAWWPRCIRGSLAKCGP